MKKFIYLFLALTIVACSDDNGSSEQSSCPIYLDTNGVTIKACEDAEVYSTGVINGITYTVVNEIVLRDMIENGDDVSKVVTTKVTDMSNLAFSFTFNQDISSWDVSNVTNMEEMFRSTPFNQPIDNWDVSSVTNMYYMFESATSFNQNLSSWSVSNVTNCTDFSQGSPLTEANTPNFTNCTP